MARLIVFSDIDGTILDLKRYSFEKSLLAIQRLVTMDIPLVLVSSKTHSEIMKLCGALGLHNPFVFENGAGIGFADGSYILLGKDVQELSNHKTMIRAMVSNCIWADDIPVHELSFYTGLSHEDVALMLQRKASLLFMAEQLPATIADINSTIGDYGIAITTGGKFFTVQDSQVNKGRAVQYIKDLFQKRYDDMYTIGIGDGYNDIDMFNAVDEAYFVGDDTLFSSIKGQCNKVIMTQRKGPDGFSDIINTITQPNR